MIISEAHSLLAHLGVNKTLSYLRDHVRWKTMYKARDIAELMFEAVYKYHGLPRAVVSDRDVLFTSRFWERLHALVGTKLKMSSAYHPQTDGSTERANRTVTQMLRQCIDAKQKDWVSKLPAIEFAINSARSESTGYAPFFLNTGMMPRSMIWRASGDSAFTASSSLPCSSLPRARVRSSVILAS